MRRLSSTAALTLTAATLLAGCGGPVRRFSNSQVLGGKTVSARRLNSGSEAYQTYCAACHGVKGDGKGAASIGLRPPPRDFRQGKYKFAAVAGGQLPNDEDFLRIVKGGLHGTAMLPWTDVPDRDISDIIQYIKTLSPRWAEGKPGEPIVPGPDPWTGAREAEGISRGLKVYHGLAQCLSCHPAYETRETINAASLELAKREATLRPDPYHAELKESDYGLKLMPPDFTRDRLRSGVKLTDLYRTIASGIGGTAMPTWKGALPDEDIWAMAHYVDTLVRLRDTRAADERRDSLIRSLTAPAHAEPGTAGTN